jgi:hypothetical protein
VTRAEQRRIHGRRRRTIVPPDAKDVLPVPRARRSRIGALG